MKSTREILGTIVEEADKPEDGKIRPEVVIYLTPQQIGDEKGAHCGGCFFFKKATSECMLTSPAKCNGEKGVCDFFLSRHASGKLDGKPFGLIPKTAAGYTEKGPTRCGLCEYWQGEEHAMGDVTSTCAKVRGQVAASGCCNNWEEC